MTILSKRAKSPDETAVFFVAAIVASAFSICPWSVCGSQRGPASVAFARQVVIYLSHTRLGFNYARAGAFFGRDRTTAAHACRIVEERRDDSNIDMIIDCLERAIDIWSSLRRGGS